MQKGCSAEMLPEMLISLPRRYDERDFSPFFFFLFLFFLTHQNSEQGLQRAGIGEGNTFCSTLVNYVLLHPYS